MLPGGPLAAARSAVVLFTASPLHPFTQLLRRTAGRQVTFTRNFLWNFARGVCRPFPHFRNGTLTPHPTARERSRAASMRPGDFKPEQLGDRVKAAATWW
jgi:hypothetical protein